MSSSNPLTPEQEANDLIIDLTTYINNILSAQFMARAKAKGVSEENILRILVEGFALLTGGYLYVMREHVPDIYEDTFAQCLELIANPNAQMTFGAPVEEIH